MALFDLMRVLLLIEVVTLVEESTYSNSIPAVGQPMLKLMLQWESVTVTFPLTWLCTTDSAEA